MGRIKKQSKGLGDTVANITKSLGIEPCTECEERKQKLNELFAYKLKVVNCPTNGDVVWFGALPRVLTNEQRKQLCELYSRVFNLPYFEPCVNCSPKPYIAMIESLRKIITNK